MSTDPKSLTVFGQPLKMLDKTLWFTNFDHYAYGSKADDQPRMNLCHVYLEHEAPVWHARLILGCLHVFSVVGDSPESTISLFEEWAASASSALSWLLNKGERVKEESAKAAEKEGRTQTLLARFVTRDIGEPDSKDGLFVGTMTQEGLQQFKRGHVFEIVRWEKEPDIEETSVLWPMKGAKAEIHINVLGPSYIKPTMESGRTRVSWGETHAAINTVCWSTEIGDVLSFEGKHLFLTEAEYVSLCEGNHD